MKNVNAYNKEIFLQSFTRTDTYTRLIKDFDIVSFDRVANFLYETITPRQNFAGCLPLKSKFSAVPFYYIDYLLEKNPEYIYDLGCGWNIFKKYIPNIIGIGAEPPDSQYFFADIHNFVDDNFVAGHQEYFDSVFAINSLHFHQLSSFKKIVEDFYAMLKPQGRGFLALNLERMIERDPKFLESNHDIVEQFCRNELAQLRHINFLVIEIFTDPINEFLDGNVRLVIEKK